MSKSKQIPKTIITISDLNTFIDASEQVYNKTDYILNHYKELNGVYPDYELLDSEYKTLKRHWFKSLVFFNNLTVARTTLRRIGYNDYLETM